MCKNILVFFLLLTTSEKNRSSVISLEFRQGTLAVDRYMAFMQVKSYEVLHRQTRFMEQSCKQVRQQQVVDKHENIKGHTQCRELALCAGSGEGCQWQALPSPVQCEETATRTRDLPVTGGKTLPLAPGPPFTNTKIYSSKLWLDGCKYD